MKGGVVSGYFQLVFRTIRRMVDYSSVTVYKDDRSLWFSINRIFSLNLTFPTVPQYPRIFNIF